MDYYDSIADGYDALHGEEQARKFTYLLQNLHIEPDAMVLDVGCGTGLSQDHISGKVVGADPALQLVKHAVARLYQVALCNAEALPFRSGSFEYVISMTAVHNFSDTHAGLTEIARVSSGTAVISVLIRTPRFDYLVSSITEIFYGWKIKKLKGDPQDIIFILIKP